MSISPPGSVVVLLALFGWLAAASACGSPASELTAGERQARIDEMFEGYQSDFPDVRNVTVEELERMQREGEVTVVDVRPEKERAISMIPGAISSDDLEANLDQYRDHPIVTYCTIGYRSGVYAEKLREKGLDVLNLRGSILAWTYTGKPLVNADGPTRRLHVYGKRWDLAADGYETVW
jgi:sodium/bile acid cotransporter 7